MKKILSFAINDYMGSPNDLRGCVNDQKNIVSKLVTDFRFEGIAFKNSQVTINLFRDELTKLVLSAKRGDIIVIHYSGHGTQLIDRNNDESDGYDEALYLYDGAFSDDEFSSILLDLEDGVTCIFVMDCCFSGTITRAVNERARFKPIVSEVDGNGFPIVRNRKSKGMNGMNHIVLTGCRSDQTSADAFISGAWNGALTFAAVRNLTPGITYKEWHKRTKKWLASRGYDQIPQLEGPDYMLNMGVFGSEVKRKKCWLLRLFTDEYSPMKIEKPQNPPKPPIG